MGKMRTPIRRQTQDSYMELVRRCPLKTIKNDLEHAVATELISTLMGRELDSGSSDYLDALLVLVNKYEDEHHAIDEHMTPQEALRALMEFNQLSQADIGRVIGSESAVSMSAASRKLRSSASATASCWTRESSSSDHRYPDPPRVET